MSQTRIPAVDIHPQFTGRWSPRAFSDTPISVQELTRFFEAARWAPSAYNAQPWRFVYALRGDGYWERLLDLLIEFNRGWAQHAAALVILISKASFTPPGKDKPVSTGSHSFDSGAAWAQFALQASLDGWHAHAMGGFDKLKAREVLAVPPGYDLEVSIAVGKLGDKRRLPEYLQVQETPSARQPVSDLVAHGVFGSARTE
jgi:nitroreductase